MTALRLCCLLVAALSLGPSFAHVLEAPPRLMHWSPALWRETPVFNGQYQVFGWLGAPLDAGTVLITGVLVAGLKLVGFSMIALSMLLPAQRAA